MSEASPLHLPQSLEPRVKSFVAQSSEITLAFLYIIYPGPQTFRRNTNNFGILLHYSLIYCCPGSPISAANTTPPQPNASFTHRQHLNHIPATQNTLKIHKLRRVENFPRVTRQGIILPTNRFLPLSRYFINP